MTAPFSPETDKDNADLLVATHGDIIRYAADSQVWYYWNGDKWEIDYGETNVVKLWTDIADQWPRQIPTNNGMKSNAHRTKSLSSTGIQNMLNLLKRDKSIQVRQSDFDCYPYELNTPQGVVDLRTGSITSNDRSHLHTKQTRYSADFAPPQEWLAFLDFAFNGDKEVIDWMQKLMGIAMIGEIVEQVMPFAVGQGGTGKSTFFETIYQIMGDYAGTRDYTFLMRGQTQHPEAIANLQGLRIVTMSEVNEGERFDEAKLKLLTGDDTLTGRQMGKPSFSFRPTHTLFLFGNTKPRVAESNKGVWRRMKLISFNRPPAKQDTNLRKRLISESPQILGWLIEGARRYYVEGFEDPASIKALTAQYEKDEDTLGQFLTECCVVEENAQTSYVNFRSEFENWCKWNGYKCPSTRSITEKLTTGRYGNISAGKINRNVRGYQGVNVIRSSVETEETQGDRA